MKKGIVVLALAAIVGVCFGQVEPSDNERQIKSLLQTFMDCIIAKDSVTMYSLFADTPVTWVGVWKTASQRSRESTNASAPSYKLSDFKTWFRNVSREGVKAELFSNAVIVEDGTIGSVTFDYSFWNMGNKGNWGKESWGLIKVNGKWRIASVLFSMELERVLKQPEEIHGAAIVKNQAIEKYMRSFIDSTHFQGTVLVAKGDSIIHQSAYGMFDVENKIPDELNTQFLIGSLTKSFVAVAIMQLVEAGLVDLRAPVQKYIPNLKPELAKGLLVHHLLKQQSGLATSLDDLTEYDIMDITPKELLDIINKSKRSFDPGDKHEYSNINYTLLAMVIENASGKRYQEYLREKTFAPLDMTQTGMERLNNVPANRAIGYRDINGTFRRVQNVVSYAFGSGDIYATIGDIFKWGRALNSNRLLSEKSKALLFNGGEKDWGYYGYGFRIQPYQRNSKNAPIGKLIRHGGTMNGFISNYNYYQEDDVTIIALSNYRNIPIRKLCFELKELSLGTFTEKRKNVYGE